MDSLNFVYAFCDTKYHSLLSVAAAPNDGMAVRLAYPATVQSQRIPGEDLGMFRIGELHYNDGKLSLFPCEPTKVDPKTAYNWSEQNAREYDKNDPTSIIDAALAAQKKEQQRQAELATKE